MSQSYGATEDTPLMAGLPGVPRLNARGAKKLQMAGASCSVALVFMLMLVGAHWIDSGDRAWQDRTAACKGLRVRGNHTNEQGDALLWRIAGCAGAKFAKVTKLGDSTQGRPILALSLDWCPAGANCPALLLKANIHGDETSGRELLLRYVATLVKNEVSRPGVLRRLRLVVVPCVNPDGFHLRRRENAKGVDLNRNFPIKRVGMKKGDSDAETNIGKADPSRQPEVDAVMKATNALGPFVAATTLHGGGLLCNYPWDDAANGNSAAFSKASGVSGNIPGGNHTPSQTADEFSFKALCGAYAGGNNAMARENGVDGSKPLQKVAGVHGGVVNGAAWYAVSGGSQDWTYLAHGTLAVTLELGPLKSPAASQLDAIYEENRDALRRLLDFAVHGTAVHGKVTSVDGGIAVSGAVVCARSSGAAGGALDRPCTTTRADGTYWRLLGPGSYTVTAWSNGSEASRLNAKVGRAGGDALPQIQLPAGGDAKRLEWKGPAFYKLVKK